ncbi:MAG: hypothetical protein K2K48_02545 [Anaeroplasmataceae bacterium]|nr:hypothetical protein [Anaeroplasmataceae bacterium]MDE6414269.1 hypothetical protein [Anaeroplasmataceae bacterium]
MRYIKKGCYKMLKITVFSIIGLLFACLVGCDKKTLKEEHVHTKVHVLKIDPTCISEGRIEYWFCSQCNRAYRDKEARYEISWEETKLPKTDHVIEENPEISPTCESTGVTRGRYCSYCKMVIEEQTELAALGHHYDFDHAEWQWEGLERARLVVSCSNDEEHKTTYIADVTSTTIPATCTEAGKTIHTATVFIDQTKYQNQKEQILLPLDHDFDLENISWTWDKDTSATAQIPCKNDSSHTLQCDAELKTEILPATCTTNGKRITKATISIQGTTYEDVKEIQLPATGHSFDYENIDWTWVEYSSVSAKVICKNDKIHQVSYDARISMKSKSPTCTTDGKNTYTATITVDGKDYTDEKEETIDALHHDFNYDEHTWKWTGYSEAKLYFTCRNDASHFDIYSAQIQTNTIPATCVATGKIIYTANINIQDKSYTDIKEEILPIDATHHDYDYEHPSWQWTPTIDGYLATAYILCKCNQSTLTFESDSITIENQESTFEKEGLKEYFAEVFIDGKSYKDSKVEKLPIKQYVSTEEEFLFYIQKDAYDLTLTNDIILKTDTILDGSYASIDLNGYTLTLLENTLCFKATHSYIQNGYLSTYLNNAFGGYVLTSDSKANLRIADITSFGGINICNANALICNADITATTSFTICSQKESSVIVEKSILRKSFKGDQNTFFWIEGANDEYNASSLSIGNQVQLLTTTHAILYNPSNSIVPDYATKPVIEALDIKEYLTSDLAYKCLSFCEDLVYTEEELLEEKLIIQGKLLVIDLEGYTLIVPDSVLVISSASAQIKNGYFEVSTKAEATSSTVITIENGCTAYIDNIHTIGSIKTENASVTFKDVVINSVEQSNE